MNNNIVGKVLFFSLLILVTISLNVSTVVYGTEGQVSTKGKISFYEEAIEPSDSSQKLNDSEVPEDKPTARLPNTGELIKSSGFVVGGVILVVVVILFLRKRKKEDLS